MAEPSNLLTMEPLHEWHKMFWDHDDKWCSNTLGPNEMDFQFSILHPHVGFHQFKEGVSRMKQFMGREHKDVECYLVGVIAGGGHRQVCHHNLIPYGLPLSRTGAKVR